MISLAKNPLLNLSKRQSTSILYGGKAAILAESNDPYLGWTELHSLAYENKLNIKYLESLILDEIDVQDMYGQTPTWWSCHQNHFKQTRLLLDADADIYQKDNQNRTLMHAAASGDSDECKDIICFLYVKGVDPTLKDLAGQTVFDDLKRESNIINHHNSYREKNRRDALQKLNEIYKPEKNFNYYVSKALNYMNSFKK